MTEMQLVPDCKQCAALCCVALAFDKSPQFANDKPAGVACKNLTPNGRCSVHKNLSQEGFKGCVDFDCHGAGQHVTQVLFEGCTWQDDPRILPPMMEAFWVMRRIHEHLLLLKQAKKLPLTSDRRERLLQLENMLLPQEAWTLTSLAAFSDGPALKDIRTFLASLRDLL